MTRIDDELRPPWVLIAAWGAIALVAGALRLSGAGHSLWLDELHTSWTIWDGPSSIALRARQGNQGPAFFSLVWAVTSIFGRDEWGLRAVSLAAGIMLAPVAGLIVWRWTRHELASVLAGLAIALDRLSIFYSQDARSYALLQLVALVQLAVFARVVATGAWRWRLAWIALAWLGFALHYTYALIVTAQVVYLLLPRHWTRRGIRYVGAPVAFDVLAIGLGWLPAAAQVFGIAARRDLWSAFVPPVELLQAPWDLLTLYPLLPLVVVPLSLAAALARAWPLAEDSRSLSITRLVASWFALVLGMAWIASELELARLFYTRYTLGVATVPALLSGLIVARLTTGRRIFAVAALLGLVVSTYGPVYVWRDTGHFGNHAREDWRAATGFIAKHAPVDAVVAVDAGLIEPDAAVSRDYLLLPVNNIYNLPADSRRLLPARFDTAAGRRELVDGLTEVHGSYELFLLQRGPAALAARNALILTGMLAQRGVSCAVIDVQGWPGRPGVAVARLSCAPAL